MADRGRREVTLLPSIRAHTYPARDSALLPALKSYLSTACSIDGPPGLKIVAREVHCSVRTLQRRLRDAGTTYARLQDEVRRERAAEFLRDPELRVADVAKRLGYSNQANFTRAFRRWAGMCPSRFRRGAAEPKAPRLLEKRTLAAIGRQK